MVEYTKLVESLKQINDEFESVSEQLSSVEVMSDAKLYSFLTKKNSKLEKLANFYKNITKIICDIETFKNMELSSPQTEKFEIENEIKMLENELEKVCVEAKVELCELDNEKRNHNFIVEINLDETCDWCEQTFANWLSLFCKNQNLSFEFAEKNETKSIIKICGETTLDFTNLTGKVKFIKNGEEFFLNIMVYDDYVDDIVFDENDLEITTQKSSGAGGQHINKTESAVRIRHIPTGLMVVCEDERSQTQNKQKAIEILKEKIRKLSDDNSNKFITSQRKKQQNNIFTSTANITFDFDLNKIFENKNKFSCKIGDGPDQFLKQVLSE